METEVFEAILSSGSKLESLSLTGYGEPFLHPRLVEMIRSARKALPPDGRIHLVSNGTALDREMATASIEAGLNGVTLSMDSLQEDAFTQIRGGASLGVVTGCLEELAAIREGIPAGLFTIGISTVAMARNIHELPDLVRFAADHGVNTIWVNNVLPFTETFAGEILYERHSQEVLELCSRTKERIRQMGGTDGNLRPLFARLSSIGKGLPGSPSAQNLSETERLVLHLARELSSVDISMGGVYETIFKIFEREPPRYPVGSEFFEKAREIALQRGLEIHLPLLVPRRNRECGFVRDEVCFVTWDGWVRPCNQLSHNYSCFHYGRPKTVKSLSFGRIPGESLQNVWNSMEYVDFRQAVGEFPFSPCGDCGLSDACGYIDPEADFLCDCNMYEQPCGDCLWSRGILQCP
jgi:putative metalloenzyme radical SAM/SPASM domain maturase